MSKEKLEPITFPKISCLTVTKDRLLLLKRAIQCFVNQTYPNKELIIISDGEDFFNASIQRYLNELSQENIVFKIIPNEENNSIGSLRNISWDTASGDLICQWDDDDQYHPRRLEIQYQHLIDQKAHASFLVDQLQLFWDDQILFLSEWSNNSTSIRNQLIPGTLLTYNTKEYRYPTTGPNCKKGEDDYLIELMLSKGAALAGLSGEGPIYLYQFHGSNTFSKNHHMNIAMVRSASEETMQQQLPSIYKALEEYILPFPLGICSAKQQIAVYENLETSRK